MNNVVQFPQKIPVPVPFNVGDSFTTEDGVRVHVMDERQTDRGRQLLLKAMGTAIWAADTAFVRSA